MKLSSRVSQATRSYALYLVLGGSGSGKSDFAQTLASRLGEPVIYLATGVADGPEMEWRIQEHKASRPASWITVEATQGLAETVRRQAPQGATVLLEDVGSLTAACLPHVDEDADQLARPGQSVAAALSALRDELAALEAWCAETQVSLVVVSSEVGLGLLPPSPVGRLYKDVIGTINQELASRAREAYLVVAGLPLHLTAAARAT